MKAWILIAEILGVIGIIISIVLAAFLHYKTVYPDKDPVTRLTVSSEFEVLEESSVFISAENPFSGQYRKKKTIARHVKEKIVEQLEAYDSSNCYS
jgi:hypothetical protein